MLVASLSLAVVARARPGAKGRFPVMGWNTWCTQNDCGVDWCSSKEVLDVAQTMKDEGLLAIGYDHILLDDCWGERDNETQKIVGDPYRFPEGMPSFIAKIHALGFKFGLYTDIGAAACKKPYAGSFGHYVDDAKTFVALKLTLWAKGKGKEAGARACTGRLSGTRKY